MARIVEKLIIAVWTLFCGGLFAVLAINPFGFEPSSGAGLSAPVLAAIFFILWLIVVVPTKLIAMLFIKSPTMPVRELWSRRHNA